MNHKQTSEIYDTLRRAHTLVKSIDISYLDNWEENAITAVHSVLYLAEKQFTDF